MGNYCSVLNDSSEIIVNLRKTPGFVNNSASQEARSSVYDLPYNKTGKDARPVQKKTARNGVEEKTDNQVADLEEVNRFLRKASTVAAQLIEECNPIEQANLAFEFENNLQVLWKHKNVRENNWGDLLNITQAVLAQVEFELLSKPQKVCIKTIVDGYLRKPGITDMDMEKALEVFSNAGFDPWCGISGKP
ncbi:MAG: hypothetical protein A2W17_01680 [Planctomycetes bacterium RBG_16_41_13]|nr:MAG: hypothetical protein A2W17_01680 [Planctomycetes bacterium RBG_16_41_13]